MFITVTVIAGMIIPELVVAGVTLSVTASKEAAGSAQLWMIPSSRLRTSNPHALTHSHHSHTHTMATVLVGTVLAPTERTSCHSICRGSSQALRARDSWVARSFTH